MCKTARNLGMIGGWRTAFTTASMLAALQVGPVGFGTVWTEAMFDPDPDGTVHPVGEVAGGHQYLVRGWDGTPPDLRQLVGPPLGCRRLVQAVHAGLGDPARAGRRRRRALRLIRGCGLRA